MEGATCQIVQVAAKRGGSQSCSVTASIRTVACTHCGALNGDDFANCIRCSRSLRSAEPADKATRRVPAPRRPGAGVAVGPGSEPLFGRFPPEAVPAAKLIVFLNLVVFAGHLLSAFADQPGLDTLLFGGGYLEALRYGALPLGTVNAPPFDPFMLRQEPWRILSACYVHFGAIHVAMNMMGLIYLAQLTEPAIGSIRFVIAYTVSGIGGFVASVLWFWVSGSVSVTAGASGAVFGLIGVMLGYLLRRRDPRWKPWFVRMVVLTFVITFVLPMQISHSAHIGGFITGVAVGALFGDGAPKPSLVWQRVVASVCVLATLGVLLAARLSPYYDAIMQAAQ